MQLVVQRRAQADLRNIADYLEIEAGGSVRVRDRFTASFDEACALLLRQPRIGAVQSRNGEVEIRRFSIPDFPKYLLYYFLEAETIAITRVLHGARRASLRQVDPT